ncbi:hypothetical protein BD310DRAFT_97265 [Dichomitus squalens]|uniref:Uncharacterized protein n=1 Tax=Dichomitus squalens TaxID=114155 RepID=A0A4Q9PJH8_9APHY|nr:hypothetical protein BD310DRAFT_97265 [Dichomitus squalens]
MASLLGLTLIWLSEPAIVEIGLQKFCYTLIPPIATFFWVPALIFEPIICLLVLWIAWGRDLARRLKGKTRTGGLAPDADSIPDLVKILAQDSAIYFLAVFAGLVVNAVLWIKRSPYMDAALPCSFMFPSILGSRLFLNMREAVLFPESHDRKRGVLRNMTSVGGPSTLLWAVSEGGGTSIHYAIQ